VGTFRPKTVNRSELNRNRTELSVFWFFLFGFGFCFSELRLSARCSVCTYKGTEEPSKPNTPRTDQRVSDAARPQRTSRKSTSAQLHRPTRPLHISTTPVLTQSAPSPTSFPPRETPRVEIETSHSDTPNPILYPGGAVLT
jgi:hypothetical protein